MLPEAERGKGLHPLDNAVPNSSDDNMERERVPPSHIN